MTRQYGLGYFTDFKQWIYYYLDLNKDFCNIVKHTAGRNNDPTFNPFITLPPLFPTWWTIWPVNERRSSNPNQWQLFPCHDIHVYSTSIGTTLFLKSLALINWFNKIYIQLNFNPSAQSLRNEKIRGFVNYIAAKPLFAISLSPERKEFMHVKVLLVASAYIHIYVLHPNSWGLETTKVPLCYNKNKENYPWSKMIW